MTLRTIVATALEDVAAITLAIAAGVWLVRRWWRSALAPACGRGADPPGEGDGFVSIDALAPPPRGDRHRPPS